MPTNSSTTSSSLSRIAAVDAAVRAVLGTAGRGREDRTRESQPEPDPGLTVFAGRLLAHRHAESLPAATRAIGIAPGTVVTPLARDALKGRAITVRFLSRGEFSQTRDPGEWGFAIDEPSDAGPGLIAAMRRGWIEDDWTELEGSPERAARWVLDRPHRGALVVTDEASVAVWNACRIDGVRAASAADPDAVARAVRRLGVNLLVVEAPGKSISWMRQLGQTFRRGGAPSPPHDLEVSRCASPR
jgi:hypothetical protein